MHHYKLFEKCYWCSYFTVEWSWFLKLVLFFFFTWTTAIGSLLFPLDDFLVRYLIVSPFFISYYTFYVCQVQIIIIMQQRLLFRLCLYGGFLQASHFWVVVIILNLFTVHFKDATNFQGVELIGMDLVRVATFTTFVIPLSVLFV